MNSRFKKYFSIFLCVLTFQILMSQQKAGRYNGLLVNNFYGFTSVKTDYDFSSNVRGGNNDLPSRFSLEEFMPEIGDQGDYGSCVGWAVGYYCASTQWNFQNGYDTKSVKDVFSPWYVWNNNKLESWGGDGGTYYPKALNWIAKYGVKLFDESPTKSTDRDSLDLMPSNIIVEGWHEIFNKSSFKNCANNEPSADKIEIENDFVKLLGQFKDVNGILDKEGIINDIKGFIVSGKPVLIGVSVAPSLMKYPNRIEESNDSWLGYEEIEYEGKDPISLDVSENYNCDVGGEHAMTIVAYNDELLGGCFKVVNSWGKDWGFDGFLYISYDDFFEITDQAFTIGEIKVVNTKLFDKKISNLSIAGAPKHGLIVEKYANGNIKSETNYVKGLKSGIEKQYYNNGGLKMVAKYQDNVALEVVNFDEENDTIDFISSYKNEYGKVRYNCIKKRNSLIYKYEMVKELSANQHYYLDKDFEIFSEKRKLIAEGDFRGEDYDFFNDTTTYSKWKYYDNDKLKHEFYIDASQDNLVIEGQFKTYTSSGEIKATGMFKEGDKFGLFQEYDDGVVTKEGTYLDNKPYGIWLSYDKQGQIVNKNVFGFEK